MTSHSITTGEFLTVGAGQWNDSTAVFSGPASYVDTAVEFTGYNRLLGISGVGTAGSGTHGSVYLGVNQTLDTGSLTLDDYSLLMPAQASTKLYIGASHLNGSLLAISGNGVINLYGVSEVSDSNININGGEYLQGNGTLHETGDASLIRVDGVGAGDTIQLDSGTLDLTYGSHFLGTIDDSPSSTTRIGAHAQVDVFNVTDAARETFSAGSGMLDLFNAAGKLDAAIHFGGHTHGSSLYTAFDQASGAMVISTQHSASSLPSVFS